MIKTQHFPPQHCGYCEKLHNTTTCKRPPKSVSLVEHCDDKDCVLGWLDYFDENMIYLFTKPCKNCLPDTWDYVDKYPAYASKMGSDGRRLGRSLNKQRQMQEARNEKLASLIPNVKKGKKN